LKAKPNEKN